MKANNTIRKTTSLALALVLILALTVPALAVSAPERAMLSFSGDAATSTRATPMP